MCNLRLLHYRSFRELGAFGPPGWLPATWDLWLFSGFAKKYNCMYHRYSKNETSNGDAYSAIIKLKYQNAVSGFYSQKCVLTNCSLREPGAIGPPLGGFRPPGMVYKMQNVFRAQNRDPMLVKCAQEWCPSLA